MTSIKKVRGSKAFATEQKIRKLLGEEKPNELIRKATNNLNRIQSMKYGFTPDQVVEKALNMINLLICIIFTDW